MKLWVGMVCLVSAAWAGNPSTARIQEAATKAVALIQKSQKNWHTKQSCFSCHQQVLPALAFRLAREHGIAVDEPAAHADAAAAFGFYSNLERAVEYTHIIDPAMNDGIRPACGERGGRAPQPGHRRLCPFDRGAAGGGRALGNQRRNGRPSLTARSPPLRLLCARFSFTAIPARKPISTPGWCAREPGCSPTSLMPPRSACTNFSAHVWAAADQGYPPEDGRRIESHSAAPMAAGVRLRPRRATPTPLARRCMALHEAGGVRDFGSGMAAGHRLPAEDAGSRWLLACGIAPASARAGEPAVFRDRPSLWPRSVHFHDGRELGSDGAGEPRSGRGTAAPARSQRKRSPRTIEPWAETLLFGSTADVKKLLDGGFDPNSATKAGRAHRVDAGRAGRRQDEAADRSRRECRCSREEPVLRVVGGGAISRFERGHESAAGSWRQSAPAQGSGRAVVQRVSRSSWPRFPATRDVIRRAREGDRVDDKMNMLGCSLRQPLLALASYAPDRVRARVCSTPAPKWTKPTATASRSFRGRRSRTGWKWPGLLIERGADVNHVDKNGMTPLLYAASIDFGDSAMIDLLLKSGARTSARTKEGLTALGLARKYHHTHLLTSLEPQQASR